LPIALDATYSIGDELSGVGVYSREILFGLARLHPAERYLFCYRAHRFLRSFGERLPRNCSRYLLHDRWHVPQRSAVFHALNQRMPVARSRRSVCTFHDLFVMTGEYSTPEFRRRFTAQAREAAERCDLIVCVSAFTAGQVASLLGVETARLRVIHHGVVARSRPVEYDSREPIILHVGAIQKRKNLERLIEAFERLPSEWTLVLAGSNGFGADQILARAGTSPARERIQLTGYVTMQELAQLYRRASVFAFPSLDEGFGMPVLEAMANGVPVLTSDRSALPEVAGDAALLVNPNSVAEIADGLERLCGDLQLRRKFADRGLRRSAQFTWERAIEQTWAVYRELY
jgi:glycosyltransferase involved in cell wall biosynthesis